MPKFEVDMTWMETHHGTLEIEADSKEEAAVIINDNKIDKINEIQEAGTEYPPKFETGSIEFSVLKKEE